MLAAITLLLLFQLAGEAVAAYLSLPVPGPVIGMGLLFAVLARALSSPSRSRRSSSPH